GQRLHDAGDAMTRVAESIQHQPWSLQPVANREQRLAAAKSGSTAALMSSVEDVNRLEQAASGQGPLNVAAPGPAGGAASASALGAPTAATAPPYPPLVVRALAVAALAALGEAGDDQTATVTGLLADTQTANCLSLAKLNLYQCLAVAKPHYEDIFCLGEHVMKDTGECVMIAAGLPPPVYIPAASTTAEAYAKPEPARKAHA